MSHPEIETGLDQIIRDASVVETWKEEPTDKIERLMGRLAAKADFFDTDFDLAA